MDSNYDSGQFYRTLSQRAITPVIKPRENSVPDTKPMPRHRVVKEYLKQGYDKWAEEKGYSRRWMAETAFSTFKRLFAEHELCPHPRKHNPRTGRKSSPLQQDTKPLTPETHP